MSTQQMRQMVTHVADGAKDFDDAGSVPLVKDPAREAEILSFCKEEASKLPEPWMPLACMRTRKYDADRSKVLMTEFRNLLVEMKTNYPDAKTVFRDVGGGTTSSSSSLGSSPPGASPITSSSTSTPVTSSSASASSSSTPKADSSAPKADTWQAFRVLPCRDKWGRGVLNTRLRHHNPKLVPAESAIRAVTLLLYNLLQGAPSEGDARAEEAEKTQLNGVCVLHDFRGISLSNVDPAIGRALFKLFTGRFPIRLAAIYIVEPPFFVRYVMLPIARMIMPTKLTSRIQPLSSVNDLKNFFEPDQLLEDFGGNVPDIDVEKLWSEQIRDFTDLKLDE
ncbi:unnamed protein product [Amoebophrya sp. A25]|nr:unnamed protein product [Amoebophrya sp. A25]|eukprot:GSA25T00027482001.1